MYGTKKKPSRVLLTPFGQFIPYGTDLPEFDDYEVEDWWAILMTIVVANQLYMDVGVHRVIIDYPSRFYFEIIVPDSFCAIRGDGSCVADVPQYPYEVHKDDNTYFIHTLS